MQVSYLLSEADTQAAKRLLGGAKYTINASRGWRRRFATVGRLPSEITSLSHNDIYDRVFHTSDRQMTITGEEGSPSVIGSACGVSGCRLLVGPLLRYVFLR